MTARLVTCFVGRVVSDFNSQRKKVIRQANSEEDVKVNTELSLSMMVQFGLVSLFDKRRINQEIKNMPRKRILSVCSTYIWSTAQPPCSSHNSDVCSAGFTLVGHQCVVLTCGHFVNYPREMLIPMPGITAVLLPLYFKS